MRKEIAILLIIVAAAIGYLIGYSTAPTTFDHKNQGATEKRVSPLKSTPSGNGKAIAPGYGEESSVAEPERESPHNEMKEEAPAAGYGK
jgi:hypothetical protein